MFNRLLSIFGKDLETKILFLLTFCDGGEPLVLGVLKATDMPVNVTLKFNNSALFTTKKDTMTETFWDINYDSLHTFFNYCEHSKPVSIAWTKETLQHREVLMRESNVV